ncbi:MAG TPA: hypothetical protein DEP88_05795 [Verrucomicrobiales bacterium]|nr:hypothetical protein [Verrucomicrobiales bacterium]
MTANTTTTTYSICTLISTTIATNFMISKILRTISIGIAILALPYQAVAQPHEQALLKAAEEAQAAANNEGARLMQEIGALSQVTELENIEVRDGLAWLTDAKEPYSGWVKKTWIIRHKHESSTNDWHTHDKFTDVAKFKGGVPTIYAQLKKDDSLQRLSILAEKDCQRRKTWVADFLMYLNTGSTTIIVMPGKAGHFPDEIRYAFYNNGTVGDVAHYQDGQRHGLLMDWVMHSLVEHSHWTMGKKDGKRVTFHWHTKLKRTEEHWENGKLINMRVWKRNGEQCNETKLVDGTGKVVRYESTRVYHKDGTISYKSTKDMETHYQNGLQHGAEIRYGSDGKQILSVGTWKNGKMHGTSIGYNGPSGAVTAVSSWNNGKKHGSSFYYFRNKLHRVTSWINGEKNGPMIQFEDDGSRMETTYVNDECGEVIHYNVNGSIRRTCINWDWVGYEGPGEN